MYVHGQQLGQQLLKRSASLCILLKAQSTHARIRLAKAFHAPGLNLQLQASSAKCMGSASNSEVWSYSGGAIAEARAESLVASQLQLSHTMTDMQQAGVTVVTQLSRAMTEVISYAYAPHS